MAPGQQLQASEFKKKSVITENDTKLAVLLPVTQYSRG
jgi:hypothetical protein